LPVIIYVHGGGWTFGSVDTHDGTMRGLAAAGGRCVFGFDYRLAPEHPYPIPLEDTLAAIAVGLSGELGSDVDTRRWALAGDSAGATLALAAMIHRREAGLALPAAAALFYGCYAPDFETGSHARFGDGYLLTTANMRWYWRNYLGAAFDAPPTLAAPLNADLTGLPPLYLTAGGLDPLADDTIRLAERLATAGCAFRHDHVPGVVHGCLRMSRDLAPAQAMIDAGAAYITERL
jgi:acetyl esterase